MGELSAGPPSVQALRITTPAGAQVRGQNTANKVDLCRDYERNCCPGDRAPAGAPRSNIGNVIELFGLEIGRVCKPSAHYREQLVSSEILGAGSETVAKTAIAYALPLKAAATVTLTGSMHCGPWTTCVVSRSGHEPL